jgi:glutamate-1-semialdehyde 2,1-aminomutase
MTDGHGFRSSIEEIYLARTPRSAAAMRRACGPMPSGITRSLSWFAPYPVVFESGAGAELTDIDGNRYLDFMLNGLSVMHGQAYPPITEALHRAIERGTAWPGASDAQIEFAEVLCRRVPGGGQVRLTNTGTEATMLAVKLARAVTGRNVIVKATGGYHGSFEDLEAGLYGRGEIAGRAALADFGDLESFANALTRNDGNVAAIIIEPIMYTTPVVVPPDGFLSALEGLARDAGVLMILDDCLMFRLAEGGSAELYGLRPDITALGKWIGGGLPAGGVVASRELMRMFDPHSEPELYHGGSFNGNLLCSVAGRIAVEHLTGEAIQIMNDKADRLRAALYAAAAELGLGLKIAGVGAATAVYVLDELGEIDWTLTKLMHLAAINRGMYLGTWGELALSTVITDEQIEQASQALTEAFADVAAEIDRHGGPVNIKEPISD